MSETAQIIVATSTLITSLVTATVALINTFRIKKIQTQTDGMMTRMSEGSKAIGNLQGRAEEKAEAKVKIKNK